MAVYEVVREVREKEIVGSRRSEGRLTTVESDCREAALDSFSFFFPFLRRLL